MTMRQALSGVAGVGMTLALLAGCTPTPAPSPTTTAAEITAPTSVVTKSVTPSPSDVPSTPSSGTPEEAIKADIQGYNDFLNKAFTDPSVPAWHVGNFVMDIPPDYLGQAVQEKILNFRAEGKKQAGATSTTVLAADKQPDGTYLAKACVDSSQLLQTAKDGQQIKSSLPRAAVEFTMSNASADKKWRISRIKGTGAPC